MEYQQQPDGPTGPDAHGADHGDVQDALFGGRPGPPEHELAATTAYVEIEQARRRRLVLRAAAAAVLVVVVIVVAVLLAQNGADETTPATQLVDAFECPDDPAPIAMVPADDLVVDGIDSTSQWLLVVDPLPELGVAWVRAADVDRSRTSLRVTTCDRVPEPTAVPVAPAEPTPTPTPPPAPTPTPAATPRPAGEVTVLVLNAAQVEGAAGRVTDALAGEGFQTQVPGNLDLQTDSQVFYAEGFEAEGELIALLLEIDLAFVEPQTDATPGGADVVVVLGAG